MAKTVKFLGIGLSILIATGLAWAVTEEGSQNELKVIELAPKGMPQAQPQLALASSTVNYGDPVRYTLGPDDVIQIDVMRHEEFSGIYPVNLEGKIQYKFVGDIDVNGLTKKGLEDKLKEIISSFVINPEINVTILEYKSKVIYVVGEVGQPGKYYMRVDSVPVREAVVNAGLPTISAAMRRCRLITPDEKGRVKTRTVDLYSILYGGNLKHNVDMHPGDVLYVPATVMAKIVRVINPVTAAVGVASSGPNDISTARSATTTLAK